MRKLTLAISILIMTLMPAAASAFEKAEPMDFIFKGGNYNEASSLVVETPYSGFIAGPGGVPIHFDYAANCVLTLTSTDEGIEVYTAPRASASAKSSIKTLPAPGYTMGLLHEPMTSSLAWFINDINGSDPQKLWTRELSDAEYAIVGLQVTMTANKGTNAFLVQYAGISPETGDIILEITDADAPNSFTRQLIKTSKLPGYFNMPGSGILHIDKLVTADKIPVLYFEWAKEPSLKTGN